MVKRLEAQHMTRPVWRRVEGGVAWEGRHTRARDEGRVLSCVPRVLYLNEKKKKSSIPFLRALFFVFAPKVKSQKKKPVRGKGGKPKVVENAPRAR